MRTGSRVRSAAGGEIEILRRFRQHETAEVSTGKVLEHLSVCREEHRVVLMLAYVDDLPVARIGELLGSSVSSTYSLLARARSELRSHLIGDPA